MADDVVQFVGDPGPLHLDRVVRDDLPVVLEVARARPDQAGPPPNGERSAVDEQ